MHQIASEKQTARAFDKPGEQLHRLESSGKYYGARKRAGKQFCRLAIWQFTQNAARFGQATSLDGGHASGRNLQEKCALDLLPRTRNRQAVNVDITLNVTR